MAFTKVVSSVAAQHRIIWHVIHILCHNPLHNSCQCGLLLEAPNYSMLLLVVITNWPI